MTGEGSTWTASIELEAGKNTIDIVTTHTVILDEGIMPISAPYTRISIP